MDALSNEQRAKLIRRGEKNIFTHILVASDELRLNDEHQRAAKHKYTHTHLRRQKRQDTNLVYDTNLACKIHQVNQADPHKTKYAILLTLKPTSRRGPRRHRPPARPPISIKPLPRRARRDHRPVWVSKAQGLGANPLLQRSFHEIGLDTSGYVCVCAVTATGLPKS